MTSIYAMLFDLLNAAERRRFYQLLALIVAMALVDTAGVASILPFLAAVADPAHAKSGALLGKLYQGLGFTEDKSFLIFLGALVLWNEDRAVLAADLALLCRFRPYDIVAP